MRSGAVFTLSVLVAACSSQRLPDAPASAAAAADAASVVLDASVQAATTEPFDAGEPMPAFEALRSDAQAVTLAEELFTKWRSVAGVERAYTMDGGYRGMIKIEPAAPVLAERKHLAWVVAAMRDFDAFFAALDAHADGKAHPPRYRFAPVKVLFFRSVHARTPSAYAHDWTVAWNLDGSLNTSADAARETLFHEIFHLNDYAHPQVSPYAGPGVEGPHDAWSLVALAGTFDAIVHKCGTKTACLAPYSPNETLVRGGTYYSFQPGNGVREYAAELGVRYYREQRAALGLVKGAPVVPPAKASRFKCGPPENARAWALVRDELFAGIDVVPSC